MLVVEICVAGVKYARVYSSMKAYAKGKFIFESEGVSLRNSDRSVARRALKQIAKAGSLIGMSFECGDDRNNTFELIPPGQISGKTCKLFI